MKKIETTLQNSVSYSGSLNVYLSVKGHKAPFTLHNNGTKYLLDTITKALAGYDISGCTPKYIDFQHKPVDKYITVLTTAVPFTGIVYGEAAEAADNEGKLLLNATITNEDKQYNVNTLYNPRLVILDSNRLVLAEITGSTDLQLLWNSITASTDAIVDWEMIFKVKEN